MGFRVLLAVLFVSVCLGSGSAQPSTTHVAIPPPTAAVAELHAALRAAAPETRAGAAWQLAGAASVPDDVLATLEEMIGEDVNEPARLAAAWALAHLRKPVSKQKPTWLYDQPPRLRHRTKPVYPEAAYRRREAGVVLVEILIDERGNVAHAEVRESIPSLDAAALDTVRAWRFEPAKRKGKVVPCLAYTPISFKIG